MSNESDFSCVLCPRLCHANRDRGEMGVCGMPATLSVARIAPHMWEEPPISGERGSGTVFFTGCNLRCIFCQNRTISRAENTACELSGRRLMSEDAFTAALLALRDTGVHNINLVTPTHYTDTLSRILGRIKPALGIPVVWNSSAYELPKTLALMDSLVDIYLPDFKYLSSDLSAAYSDAPDYATVATEALLEMYRQVGPVTFDENGMMTRGMIIRHLVLPGCRSDSIAVLRHLANILPVADIRLSIMRQYTPDFAMDTPHKNLHRRLTDFEYNSVLSEADRLGFRGYTQGKDAADKAYTPDFDVTGI